MRKLELVKIIIMSNLVLISSNSFAFSSNKLNKKNSDPAKQCLDAKANLEKQISIANAEVLDLKFKNMKLVEKLSDANSKNKTYLKESIILRNKISNLELELKKISENKTESNKISCSIYASFSGDNLKDHKFMFVNSEPMTATQCKDKFFNSSYHDLVISDVCSSMNNYLGGKVTYYLKYEIDGVVKAIYGDYLCDK